MSEAVIFTSRQPIEPASSERVESNPLQRQREQDMTTSGSPKVDFSSNLLSTIEAKGLVGKGILPPADSVFISTPTTSESRERQDKKEDDKKPETKDDPKKLREEAEKAIAAMQADVKAGKWSETSQKAFKRIFDENKDLTPEKMQSLLNRVGAAVNDLVEDDTKNRVGMSVAKDDKGNTTFRMLVTGPNIDKAAQLKDILADKESDTQFVVGKIKRKD